MELHPIGPTAIPIKGCPFEVALFRGSRGGGRGSAFFKRGFNYSRGTYQNRGGKTNISGNSAFRKILRSPSNSKENISKCITSSSPSRETKIFPRELEDSNKRLQDGRTSPNKRSVKGRGLYGETRPKGCLFFSKKRIQKISQIPVERGDLSISMPMLRSGPSSQKFSRN